MICLRHIPSVRAAENASIPILTDHWADVTTLCGRNSVQIRRREGASIDLDDLARRLEQVGSLEKNRFLLRALIDGYQLTVFADGRAIVNGTYDMAVAKSLYARYIGN